MSDQAPPPSDAGPPSPKRLYRSRNDRMLGGVCGGVASYFNIDPTLVRILAVATLFMGGAGAAAYIVAWIIVPEEPSA